MEIFFLKALFYCEITIDFIKVQEFSIVNYVNPDSRTNLLIGLYNSHVATREFLGVPLAITFPWRKEKESISLQNIFMIAFTEK